jgi:hypothetical protein
MLKMEDKELFDVLSRQSIHTQEFDHINIPVMMIVERSITTNQVSDTTIGRLCNLASKWGLTFKIFMQDSSSDEVREWHCLYPNNDVDKYLKEMGLKHGSAGEGRVASAMQAIVEDTYMEMNVFFSDESKDIEDDGLIFQDVNDFLTKP